MATISFDNRDVQITSVFFRQSSNEHRFVSYPRRLVYGGREYILAEQ
jgi:hypothetical protein